VLAYVEAVRGIGDAIYLVYRIIPGTVYKTPAEELFYPESKTQRIWYDPQSPFGSRMNSASLFMVLPIAPPV
jgi:hypothetical protein